MHTRAVAAVSVAGLTGMLLSGCDSPHSGCGAGYAPTFTLTVEHAGEPELSIQFCAGGKCSPIPRAGKIPSFLTDSSDEHASFIEHLSRGEWTVRPELSTPPTAGAVSLFSDGVLVATRQVHLTWPQHDPCAASNPPAPHVTVTST